MGYKMIEISTEAKGEIMEHANKAYEHIGKMLDCLDEACESSMGMRSGMREDYDGGGSMGQRGGMRSGMRSQYGMRGGYRDPYYE